MLLTLRPTALGRRLSLALWLHKTNVWRRQSKPRLLGARRKEVTQEDSTMNKANIARLIHRCRACSLFRTLANALFDPYRPELHYMRGPGPQWRAKHQPRR